MKNITYTDILIMNQYHPMSHSRYDGKFSGTSITIIMEPLSWSITCTLNRRGTLKRKILHIIHICIYIDMEHGVSKFKVTIRYMSNSDEWNRYESKNNNKRQNIDRKNDSKAK